MAVDTHCAKCPVHAYATMPPKASSASLTDSEIKQLRIYHRCSKTKPEIGIENFASLGGFGNVASARASIGRLRHKISNDQEASGADSPTKDAGDEGAAPVTPASKKKACGRKCKADAAEANDAEDESPTKKKASPTRRKVKAAANAASQEEDSQVKSEAGESDGGA